MNLADFDAGDRVDFVGLRNVDDIDVDNIFTDELVYAEDE